MFEKGLHLVSSFLDHRWSLRDLSGYSNFLSHPLMVKETFLIVQNIRNSHIFIDVVKQYIAQNAYCTFEKIAKNLFSGIFRKKLFLVIFSKNRHFRVGI
jgi:hypothetical protein